MTGLCSRFRPIVVLLTVPSMTALNAAAAQTSTGSIRGEPTRDSTFLGGRHCALRPRAAVIVFTRRAGLPFQCRSRQLVGKVAS